jgi:RNA ligase (TIGR02306 family)
MRKLVSVQSIRAVSDIENADRIQAYQINEWWVVDKKGAYQVGDKIIYCEIDSWIPHNVAPFLSGDKTPKTYEGVEGARLRTKRLRGFYSQGLILPMSFVEGDYEEDTDLTDVLGFKKWEETIPAALAGEMEGAFPVSLLPKSDEDRLQNLGREFAKWQSQNLVFIPSEKIEGSSITTIFKEGWKNSEVQVGSRNWLLRETDGNAYWQAVNKYDLKNVLPNYCRSIGRNLAVRAELVGPGLNKNIYDHTAIDMLVYNIYDLDTQSYVPLAERLEHIAAMNLRSVPIFTDQAVDVSNVTIPDLLTLADGETAIGFRKKQLREGLVWVCTTDPNLSFKTVSNKYLDKEK